MEEDLHRYSDFDDIVFNNRNKEYGAYLLRKKYSQNVLISITIGIIIITTTIITPYLNARALQSQQKQAERQVEIKLENPDQLIELVAPPPPPPPTYVVQQQKYVAPQVVDSIKPEDVNQHMTADPAQSDNANKGVDPSLDSEAIRVVNTFPQFKPGKQEGISVPVWFTIYINFKLK